MIAYKALRTDGTSPNMGHAWPLPQDGRPGAWETWEGTPAVGYGGLHGYTTLEGARAAGVRVYEMQLKGEVARDGGRIVCATRARLLRLVHDENGPVTTTTEEGAVAGTWRVVCEPVGTNPGLLKKAASEAGLAENTGGMVIYLVNADGVKEEVSRVAYVRRNAKNPKNSFDKQLDIEMEKAEKSIEILNAKLAAAGELQ